SAGAVGVEQRNRRRLLAARSLVGVVAHNRSVGDRAVDTTIDAGEAGVDLVDRAMEVVDTALEGHGEIEKITASTPEHDRLSGLHVPEAPPEQHTADKREPRRDQSTHS